MPIPFLNIKLSLYSLVLFSLLLTSCAVISPQTVVIRPELMPIEHNIGHSRAIALSVTDQRQDTAFGPRGGVYYETSLITPANDVAIAIRKTLSEALNNYGFKVLPAGEQSPLTLHVEIHTIRYIPVEDPLLNKIRTDTTLKATGSNGQRSYTGEYSVSSALKRLTLPNEQENTQIINKIIAKTLDRLLSDKPMMDILTGQSTSQ